MRNRKIESHNIHIDSDYIEWITELKQRYRSAQVKAVMKVNAEKLQFNWLLGQDLVRKKAEERWGSGVVEQLSLDMQRDFPDADGFSVSNLWFMKKWYCFYTQKEAVQKLQQPVAELESEKLQQPVREFEKTKLHQVGAEMPAFFAGVPWGHHIAIITKCKSVDEALFYIKKTVEQGMSRAALINCIKADLYSHQGKIVNNFTEKLPDLQSKLVQDVLKEHYGRGAGYALLQKAMSLMPDKKRFAVWTLPGNERALRFYERNGFIPDGAEMTYTLGKEVTLIRLVKEITGI